MASDVEHKTLPEGHWWACEHPERPNERGITHYRPRCRRCYPAWRAAAAVPGATFLTDKTPTPSALPPDRYTEAEVLAWWMEGVRPEGTPDGK